MKKHYFLLLAAGLLSCLSVNAQNRLNDPKSERGSHHPKAKGTALLPAPKVLTRAAAEALPDSTVFFDYFDGADGDKYGKEVYTYSENGQLVKTEEFEWNPDISEWELWEDYTFVRDERGLVVTYTKNNEEGEKYVQNFKYEGNSGTYTAEFSSPYGPTVSYKGNATYDDFGNCLTQTEYIAPDINGDGVIDAGDYNADGTPWYKNYEATYEYDADGKCTKQTYLNFDAAGEVYCKEVTVTVWDGKSYTETDVTEYPEDGETYTYEYKYEVKDGNPEEGLWYWKDKDTGEWDLQDKSLIYYPKGGETGNETVEAPTQDVVVAAADGRILVSALKSVRLEVYNIIGKCCYNAVVNGNGSITGLPAGIYVVRADGKATKVYVR